MNRILVIGSGGAGKSTLATRLGEILDLPVIHLDQIYWQPGWVEPPKDEWSKTVAQLLTEPSWIIDGNYSGTLESRLEKCETVIFLDISRWICVWRVLKRTAFFRKRRRPDMAEGCEERFNREFLLWVWNYPKRTRGKILARLDAHMGNKRVIRLQSNSEVRRFLAQLSRRESFDSVV